MGNSHMYRLAKGAGYCCVSELLRSNELYSGQRLARILGVAPSTVSYWTQQRFTGLLPLCPQCPRQDAPRKLLRDRPRA